MSSELLPFACDDDGAQLGGLVAWPERNGPHSAVLVMHNALGIGSQVKGAALELAALGYAAIVTDMYGGGAANLSQQEAGAAYSSLLQRPHQMRERILIWYQAATSHPRIDGTRIAAIGYCFGGQCVLELARSGADVRLVSSFHGILKTHAPAEPGVIKGKVLAWCGGKDPYAPTSDIATLRNELEHAAAAHDVVVFEEAAHNFTDENAAALEMPGIAYDADAHRRSWDGTVKALAALL